MEHGCITHSRNGRTVKTVGFIWQICSKKDYLEKARIITGQYYADLLSQFDIELKRKQPHLAKKKVLFHHDNAPVYLSIITIAKQVKLPYELMPYPPYSPDLAPCNFFLFPNLKKWLSGKRFMSNKKVIGETQAYFTEFDKT
ncbi:histone-lysine N-methyltransferase SETMAR-like [Ptiloglossa arizonensis]|uniref:histone-lysine N-methyltransferase SETMAR-like n=1 Tax=Ptiloglossa arizonensis TaxID=3350558 RepID=UPI003FA07F22